MAQERAFDLQGHRGARGNFPENSIPGFIHAIQCGVSTLELDIVFSKDLDLIVSHEPWMSCEICLDPSGNPIHCNDDRKLNIFMMSLEEIQAFDCGTKFHPRFPEQLKIKTIKPTLNQVFEEIEAFLKLNQRSEIRYNIEIKSYPEWDGVYQPTISVICENVLEILGKYNLAERCVIQSFDSRVIKYLHGKHEHLAFLIEKHFEIQDIIDLLGFYPQILSPHYSLVDEQLIQHAQINNFKLIPWTVNDKTFMKKIYEIGCHGLITDFPCDFSR
ncbi:MAG: glycerophosphodiester phosphodiesterase family protein [Flavobacteriales bacterium]